MKLHTAGALIGVSIPIGYLIKKHVDWEQHPDSKKRMLIHQGAFWTTVVLSLQLIHNTFWKYRHSASSLKMLRLIGAGLLPVIGFEGGMRLAVKLVPRQPLPEPALPAPALGARSHGTAALGGSSYRATNRGGGNRVYTPRYLQSGALNRYG